ncbi:DUF3748 domain-containing protein [Cyclobacterium sp. GBPx2]|uniref:DUF3748 domain-containing protein n=2 Tax=Cyclobacterium plantarum TaxID=2716263 RepID=A0ABX0H6X8_9BACT|nr:DUF3748 domain-containing protein [Cyclobacterium plantarum]
MVKSSYWEVYLTNTDKTCSMLHSFFKTCAFAYFMILLIRPAYSQDLWNIRQLTFKPQNHELDHNQNFSPDDQWIVYDTRPDPAGIALNDRIEKVHVENGESQIIYQVASSNPYGPGVGAVSYHPYHNQVVFIHGLPLSDEDTPYAGHRRLGMIVDESAGNRSYWMDSRDVSAPFTPGALRGGTHRHQWSGDGDWLGFTYNDALMVALQEKTGKVHDLRTVGVSKKRAPVIEVDMDQPGENIQGSWFSVVLVKVVAAPKPGSDEISRAYSDWWVGKNGYQREDGSWQLSRAFLGDLLNGDGKKLTEVFIVDVPEDIHKAGNYGPLEGTLTTMPMPPKDARWRRLTFTENRKYPGVSPEPRHWVSSSMDGTYVSYLAKDDRGIVQVFLVPSLGGNSIQVSFHDSHVQSMVSWHPEIREFAYVCDNAIYLNRLDEQGSPGLPRRISPGFVSAPYALAYSRNGNRLAFNKKIEGFIQVFLAERP